MLQMVDGLKKDEHDNATDGRWFKKGSVTSKLLGTSDLIFPVLP